SSRRRHTRSKRDWSSDVCSSDLHIQHIRDAFTGEKMGLDRDDAVVRRRKSVDGQQFVFQAAVDDDIVVGVPQEWHEAVHDLFTGPLSVTHGVILGELHHLKPGRRIGQPTVGGHQGESASRVKDPAFKVNFQVLRVVNGGQQKICQCSFLFSGGISQCGREIALGVVVNEENFLLCVGQGRAEVQRCGRFAYTALEICDGYDLAHVPHPFILQCPGNRQKNWDQTSKALCSKSLLDLIPTITPVLEATATTTGLSLRRCALAAMVTAVSVMPQASFPMVFPVQGAITSTSSSFFGPMGSASLTLPITVCPVIFSTAEINSSAVPKR